MSELQTDEPQQDFETELQEEILEHETETGQESGSELAPDSESQHEQNDEGFNQEAVNKVINKKHAEKMDALRRVEAERKRNEELQEQLSRYQQSAEPVVPDMPDPFGDDYEVKMEQREQALIRKAQFDENKRIQQQQQQQQHMQQQQAQMDNLQKSINEYTDRAKASGITDSELEAAGNTVAAYGINENHALAILHDTDGPLITSYLAKNPAKLAEISSMSEYQLAVHIERNIRPNALNMKPKTTSAPKPAHRPSGAGADKDAGKHKHIGNATFE